jgi:uncharacterized protein
MCDGYDFVMKVLHSNQVKSKYRYITVQIISFIGLILKTFMQTPDPTILTSLVSSEMPYGKYKGTLLCNMPIHYLEWMKRKGFPKGKLGVQLETVYEIKLNGLEEILERLKMKK